MSLDFPASFGRDGSPAKSIDSFFMPMPTPAKFTSRPQDRAAFSEYGNFAVTDAQCGADTDMVNFALDLPLPEFLPIKSNRSYEVGNERKTGRKRSKADVEERKERQAAKNRETAKAFRHKMDTLKTYSEHRVAALKVWIQGLAELVYREKEEIVYSSMTRSLSAPL